MFLLPFRVDRKRTVTSLCIKTSLAIVLFFLSLILLAICAKANSENEAVEVYITKDGVTGYTPVSETISFQGNAVSATYVITVPRSDAFKLINNSGGTIIKGNYFYFSGYANKKRWENGKDLVTEIDDGSFLTQAVLAETDLRELGYSSFESGCSTYYYVMIKGNSNFAILIQNRAENKVDKTALYDAINAVPTSGYYDCNDKWNGKEYSETGFWAEMQAIVQAAQDVYDNAGATLTAVEAEVAKLDQTNADSALSIAINKLISIQQLNATYLYETVLAEQQANRNKSLYTENTWDAYDQVKTAAEEFLKALFDEDGTATELNKAANQSEANYKANALTDAAEGLYSQSLYEQTQTELPVLKSDAAILFQKINKDGLHQADYTADSWTAFENAFAAAEEAYGKNFTFTGAASERNDLIEYRQVFSDLYKAWLLLEQTGDVHVNLTVNDLFGITYPDCLLVNPATATFSGSKSLDAEKHSLKDLFAALNWDGQTSQTIRYSNGSQTIGMTYVVYVNGIVVRDPFKGQLPPATNPYAYAYDVLGLPQAAHDTIQLHDGDDVVILRAAQPMEDYYGNLNPVSDAGKVAAYFNLLRFTTDEATLSPKEGEGFTLSLQEQKGYWSTYDGRLKAASGKEIIAYGPMKEDGTYPSEPIRTGFITDAQGNVTVSLDQAGTYFLTAMDAREVDYKNEVYPSLTGGAHIIVTIAPLSSSELAEKKTELREKLDALLAESNENDYEASDWADLQEIIANGKEAIQNADSMQAVQDAYDQAVADFRAVPSIDHESILALFAHYLKYLPSVEQINDGYFSKADIERMGWITALYDAMSDYQKEMLSPVQQAQYDALISAYGTDGSSLPEFKQFTATVSVDENDLIYLDEPSQLGAVFYDADGVMDQLWGNVGFNNNNLNNGMIPTVTAGYDTRHKTDAFWLVVNISKEHYDHFDGIEIEGAEVDSSEVEEKQFFYRYTYYILSPYEDFTIHVKAVQSDLQKAKNAALTELENALNSYSKSDYTADNWAVLTAAYSTGVAAINAATNEAAVTTAKETALDAMHDVEKGGLGTVTVIVENTTYTAADFTNTIVDTTVNLTTDSTMMKCVLTALATSDTVYSWTGTGGKDYEITYLSSIYIDANGNGKPDSDEKSLAEFDGGPQSGWMGTLNDWFVNEGFNMFTVANGKLKDGDVIRVQYTVSGYGTDLGATWANNDTSLKELAVDGGSFGPEFNGSVLEYVLTPGGGSVSLLPTAANKNFQVRIFLNQQNKNANAEYYRQGESIPVKSGDVIWIGVGEKAWASMNDGSITGTWYKLHVVSKDDANAVVKLINAIGSITYSNYETKQNAVDLARAAYDALNSAAQSSVTNLGTLESAETAIAGYQKVDALKAAIAALPRNITEADREAVEAAKEIYDDLAENAANLLNLLSVAETNKLLEAVNALTEQPKSDDAGVKSIKVNGVKATGSGTSYAVTLPIGSDVATVTFEIEPADKANVTDGPTASDGGTTWSFTVTAENGATSETYTVTLTVSQMEVNVLECAVYSVTDDVTVVELSPVVVTGLREAVKVEELGLPETAQSVSLWLKVTAVSKNGSDITVKLEPMFAVDGGEEQAVPDDALIGSLTVTLPISCTANAKVRYGTTYLNATGSGSGITFAASGSGSYTIIPDPQIQGDAPAIGNGSSEGTTENGVTTFAAGTAADAPTVSVTAPEGGWTMDGTTANSFTVSCENDVACVVLVKSADGSYTRLIAENAGTTHTFHTALNSGDELVVVVKGDISGDGKLSGSEVTQIKAAQLKSLTFTEFENLVADLDGNGKLSGSEVTQIKAAQLRLLTLAW